MDATITCHPYTLEARRNLVLNPRPASTAQWSTAVNATNLTLSGVASTYLAWTAVAAGASSIRQIKNIPINGVSPISARAACTTSNAPNTARLVHIQLRFYDGSGTQLSLVNGADVWVSNPVFTTVKFENVVPPAGATQVAIYIVGTATAANERFFANLILLEQASTAGAYFDGDTPDTVTPPVEYSWKGPAAAAASVMRTPSSSDTIVTKVEAPWRQEFESSNQVHRFMDQPSSSLVTVRSGSGRAGELVARFEDHETAYKAFRSLGYPHLWFELTYTDAPDWLDSVAGVPQFIISPDGRVALEQQEPFNGAWAITIPWTEVYL